MINGVSGGQVVHSILIAYNCRLPSTLLTA